MKGLFPLPPGEPGQALPVPSSAARHEELSPGALAFVGDAVYALLVRSLLVGRGPARQGDLHAQSVKAVRAAAQARSLSVLEPYLSDDERDVVRRARNARVGKGRGGTLPERHSATGFEALLGYLYISGRVGRLGELFDILASSAEGFSGGDGSERRAPQAHP